MLLTVLQNLPPSNTPSSSESKVKKPVLSFLSDLNQELKDLKHKGNPSVEEISDVSAKIFKASIQSDKR